MKSLLITVLIIAVCSCRQVEPTRRNSLSEEQTKSLVALGQLWGFLKYHHPAVAEGQFHWDETLISLIPSVMNAKDEEVWKASLDSLVRSLPPVIAATHTSQPKQKVRQKADYGILFDATYYHQETISQLQHLLHHAHITENHYVRIHTRPKSNEPVITITNEPMYEEMSFPPLPYRILALFRYWSIIHYFFPYRELCDTRWADVLALMLPDFVFAEDRQQYALACLKLASLIDDSHGFVQIADSTTHYDIYGRRKVPFETQFVENQLVVTSFTSQNSEVRKEVSIGDIITTINGEKVETVVARMYPYTPASNDASKHRDIARNILQTNDSVLNIGFLRDGKTATMTIPTYRISQLTIPDIFNPKPKQEGYSIILDSIGYIYPATGKFDERKTKLPLLMKSTKGLIIDLRCYPSDYMAQNVASYLMKYPGYYCHKTHGSVSMPGYTFFFQHHPSPINLDIGSYPYKVVMLVNEVTQSQAEDHTFFYHLASRVTIIGSTTAGADGRVTRFAMPGNIICYFTGWGVYYPDGTCLQRAGVKLDEEVRPTIAGIKEGRDEVLERAIDIISSL